MKRLIYCLLCVFTVVCFFLAACIGSSEERKETANIEMSPSVCNEVCIPNPKACYDMCIPAPKFEAVNTEEYKVISENTFQSSKSNPLSTFSIDVDGASYSNVRKKLMDGTLPDVDAVRIEEFVNYFNYSIQALQTIVRLQYTQSMQNVLGIKITLYYKLV